MAELQLTLTPTEVGTALEPRQASIRDRISHPFDIAVWAVSRTHDLDLDAVIGNPASLRYRAGEGHDTVFHGVCLNAEHLRSEADGLSTYAVNLGPRLALLEHRRNYRHFQQRSAIAIVRTLLDEWSVPHLLRLEENGYPSLDMRMQYGETDLQLVQRLLECEGVSYYFEHDANETRMVLDDHPHTRSGRAASLPFVDSPNRDGGNEYVTAVRFQRNMRAGRFRVRAHDFRRSSRFDLAGDAAEEASESEGRFERYHYLPGAFATSGHEGGESPVADDRGSVRGDMDYGQRLARVGMERHVGERSSVHFLSNAFDLHAGSLFTLTRHPRPELADRKLLVRELRTELYVDTESSCAGVGVDAARPFRPAVRHPQRRIHGLESATVVGPAGEEIHTDEFGRVRVQFPWDREGAHDERSSAWVRVSYGWAGAGFGMVSVPRIGQEVVIAFLGGDPDQPIVVGRLYNGTHPPPHTLPEGKTISAWRSRSTPSSEGYNELYFDDRAGAELVYLRAERDREKLVRHDERENVHHNRTVEIGGDHEKTVKGKERIHTVGKRVTRIDAEELRKVQSDEHVINEGVVRHTGNADLHAVRKGVHRSLVQNDAHVVVTGALRERTDGKRSVLVGEALHLRVGTDLVAQASSAHVLASSVVIEASDAITLKVGASFISLDPTQIAISGPMVLLNSGGSAGSGPGCSPDEAEEAEEAVVADGE